MRVLSIMRGRKVLTLSPWFLAMVVVSLVVALGPHGGSPAAAQVDRATVRLDGRAVTVTGVPVVTVTQADADDNVADIDAVATQRATAVSVALNRAAEARLAPEGRFVVEVRAAIEAAFARLLESAIRIILRMLAALMVLALFWGIAVVVRHLMRFAFLRVVDDLTVENLINQVAYYAVWIVGVVVAIDALGLDPATVATGLGLTDSRSGSPCRTSSPTSSAAF